MVRKNLMNALLVVLAAGALLTVYNAFLNSNNDSETNASTKLASYLNVDTAKQEVEGAEDIVAGTDQTAPESAVTTEEAAATPEQTQTSPETPAADQPAAETTESPAPAPASPAGDKAESVYTVKDGDTYGCIAEKYYGSYEHYVDIMAANPVNQTGFGEYHLFVGAQLILPAISGAQLKPASSLC